MKKSFGEIHLINDWCMTMREIQPITNEHNDHFITKTLPSCGSDRSVEYIRTKFRMNWRRKYRKSTSFDRDIHRIGGHCHYGKNRQWNSRLRFFDERRAVENNNGQNTYRDYDIIQSCFRKLEIEFDWRKPKGKNEVIYHEKIPVFLLDAQWSTFRKI